MRRCLGALTCTVLLVGCSTVTTQRCPPQSGIAVQVLGSGGPIADDARASSSYLVWIDGRSRLLMDAGGGSFLRFGEATAAFDDLNFIGLSHFHTDHSADLSALLKSGYFASEHRPITISGPDAGGPFPGLASYLGSLLDKNQGAYRYLSGYLDDNGGLSTLVPVEVQKSVSAPQTVYSDEVSGLRIDALHVPHGIVPSVAYRVAADDRTLVFSSDQNGDDPSFVDFARNADLLIMHMAIPENADAAARKLHATPKEIGAIAAESNVKLLVLSHLMARSLRQLPESIDTIRKSYDGELLVAADLSCIAP